jgi:hypothetical protein
MTSKSLEFKISGIIKLAKMVNTQEAARDAITRRHPPIPAPARWNLTRPNHLQQHL